MDKKISHLSKEEIKILIKRYYAGEPIKFLLEEYKINLHPSQLVKSFPRKISDVKCEYCNKELEIEYLSRTYGDMGGVPRCYQCGHVDSEFCECQNCLEKQSIKDALVRQKKIDDINYIFKNNSDELMSFDEISLEDHIFLGALLREGLSEDLKFIKPIEEFENPLAPTEFYKNQIISQLESKNLIKVHEASSYDSFYTIDTVKKTFSFYRDSVKWALNVEKKGFTYTQVIDLFINPPSEKEISVYFSLWKEVSVFESLEYLLSNILNVFGVRYKFGDKTLKVLHELVENYSVAEIYTIIYRSTNNALRFKAERGIGSHRAINTIIGNALNFSEIARNKNWDLQKYHRSCDCPESALSMFLFDRILKIGNNGFYSNPSKTNNESE